VTAELGTEFAAVSSGKPDIEQNRIEACVGIGELGSGFRSALRRFGQEVSCSASVARSAASSSTTRTGRDAGAETSENFWLADQGGPMPR
jgi:hypothetical protein